MTKRTGRLDRIHGRFEGLGLRATRLDEPSTGAMRAAWRRAYGGEATRFDQGELVDFDWHLFSFGRVPAERGPAALAAYGRQRSRRLVAIPATDGFPAFTLEVLDGMPDFKGFAEDYFVCPPDLAWTLACTHEDNWLGPFFAARPSEV